jgi:serine protease Do
MSMSSAGLALAVLGTVAVVQLRRPEAAQARPPEPAVSAPARSGAPLTLDTFRDIARAAGPGVVNINTKKIVKRQALPDPFRDFFGQDSPFGGGRPEREAQRSLGSGFVIDRDGYILTNRHVVEGADEIKVTLPDKKTYEAKLVGKDARTDVALIKIEPRETLAVLPLGDSDKVEAGEWVMAIGSPFEMTNSVTVGVVSFTGRSLRLEETSSVEMIQTDAAINPGNSGGPLLNTSGQVIGINTLIFTQGVAQSSGVGFAVPINVAKGILAQLKTKGSVTRGWLGVSIEDMSEDLAQTYGFKEAKGAVVGQLTLGSPAEKAGLQPEDVILAVDDKEIHESSDLVSYVSSRAPGTSVRLRVFRGGSEKTLSATLGTFPDEQEREARSTGGEAKLGMTYRDLSPREADQLQLPRGTKGVVVTQVEPGEAAEEANLQRGDVILSVNSQVVTSADEFEKAIDKARPNKRARLRCERGANAFVTVIQLE